MCLRHFPSSPLGITLMQYNCMEIYKSHFSAWYGKGKRDIRDVVLNGGFQWKVMANICEIAIST